MPDHKALNLRNLRNLRKTLLLSVMVARVYPAIHWKRQRNSQTESPIPELSADYADCTDCFRGCSGFHASSRFLGIPNISDVFGSNGSTIRPLRFMLFMLFMVNNPESNL